MKVFVGCSGYSYEDWIGTFYPKGITKREMVEYYERFFEVVEINFTYYAYPSYRTVDSIVSRTKRLKFFFKLHSDFTHSRKYTANNVENFAKALSPAVEEGRCLGLLAQFPESFRYTKDNLNYILRLREDFQGFRFAIEVRHISFLNEEFMDSISGLENCTLVNVDAPRVGNLLIGPWRSFDVWNYVRLHGRNASRWYRHTHAYERYDYLYSRKELEEIASRIEQLGSEEVFVFFNNHYQGKGPKNALELMSLLNA